MIQALWPAVWGIILALPPESDFKSWFEEGDYRVLQVAQEGHEPWIRSTRELPAQLSRLREVLTRIEDYAKVFEGDVKSVKVLERSKESLRAHVVWAIPFPYANRDAVVRYSWKDLPDGGLELSWTDDAREGDPKEGVRIEHVRGVTQLTKAGEQKTRVTYTYYGDLGGSFPGWIKDMAWKKEPKVYFDALSRATSPQ